LKKCKLSSTSIPQEVISFEFIIRELQVASLFRIKFQYLTV
jgi:hypothetical protein